MDAFSLLAAPLAGAQQSGHDPARLIGFFAQEMQLFFQHIQSAVVTYTNTGELPHSLFTQKALKTLEKQATIGEKRKEKGKRKPSAFNLFVKEKLEEFKAKGVKDPAGEEGKGANNSLFRMAVAEWGKLSEEEKAEYQAKFAPVIAGAAGGEEGGEESGGHEEEDADDDDSSEDDDSPKQMNGGGFAKALAAASPPKKKKAKH